MKGEYLAPDKSNRVKGVCQTNLACNKLKEAKFLQGYKVFLSQSL